MRIKYLLPTTVICCFLLFFSCEKKEDNGDFFQHGPLVFKFQKGKDYTDHVYVLLNEEKTKIIGYPSYGDIDSDSLQLIDYYKGYYFGVAFTYGKNTAYLDIKVEEFDQIDDTITSEQMWNSIIDKDPYAEFYTDENHYLANPCPECLNKDTTWPANDTAKFHRLVDNNELGKYLQRLK